MVSDTARHVIRAVGVILCCVLLLFIVTGCSANDAGEAKSSDTFYVVVCGSYIDEDGLNAFADTLREAMPVEGEGEPRLSISSVSTGNAQADPMYSMAGMTRIAGLMASGEIDLMICDAENGARNARAESFLPITEIEGLDGLENRGIMYTALDDEGNPTDALLPAYGIDLSDNTTLKTLVGPEVGGYVVANTKQPELCVQAIQWLAGETD